MTNLDSRDITLPTKVCLVKAMVFPVVLYGCESWTIKESWKPKNWCFWTVVLEKTLESPLECKEIQPVNSKGNQSWIFIERADAKAETPILWPPDEKNWLTGKDPDAGKDWRWEEKGMTEEEMVGSLTRWTWVWAISRSWWWTGNPGVLHSMGSQRVGHDWATELTERNCGLQVSENLIWITRKKDDAWSLVSQKAESFIHSFIEQTCWAPITFY